MEKMEEGKKSSPLTVNTVNQDAYSLNPRFTDLQPVGCGGTGLVYSARDAETETKVAIKTLSFGDARSCREALREIRIIRHLEHENVLTVHDVLGANGTSVDPSHANVQDLKSMYVVQELLDTDLHRVIKSGLLGEDHIQLFLYQLLRGMKYIHSANVLHRDLKPSNILINTHDLVLKIGDFGLARIVDPKYSHKGHLTENIGTCWYKSPEMIMKPKDYTKAIDMWSIGCILAEMFIGKPLFPGAHELDQILLILDSVHLDDNDWNSVLSTLPNKLLKNHPLRARTPLYHRLALINPLALDVIEQLLCYNPSKRLTAEETLSHPYLTSYAYAQDEPVALRPFHIESEVDDLCSDELKQLILNESQPLGETCGTYIPQPSFQDGRLNTARTAPMSSLLSVSSLPKEVEKNKEEECEKDTVDLSPEKLEEERELSGNNPAESAFEISREDIENGNYEQNPSLNGQKNLGAKPSLLVGGSQNTMEPLFIDVENSENVKEFSQPSPKDLLPEGHCNKCEEGLLCDNEQCSQGNQENQGQNEDLVTTDISIVQGSNSETTYELDDLLGIGDLDRAEKEKLTIELDGAGAIGAEKYEKVDQEKSLRKKKQPQVSFDELYRLPTEHLPRRRHRSKESIINKRKIHQQLNEKLRAGKIKSKFIEDGAFSKNVESYDSDIDSGMLNIDHAIHDQENNGCEPEYTIMLANYDSQPTTQDLPLRRMDALGEADMNDSFIEHDFVEVARVSRGEVIPLAKNQDSEEEESGQSARPKVGTPKKHKAL